MPLRRLLLVPGCLAVILLLLWVLPTPEPVEATTPIQAQQDIANPGKVIYTSLCAQCHGEKGDGNGPVAASLFPRPRDFTAGLFKIRSTESGSIPTDMDLVSSVLNGLHGTAMPDWKPFLAGDSLRAVLAYVKSFSPRFQSEKPKPVRQPPLVPPTQAGIAAGKRVFAKLQCAQCHGTDGKGKDAIATGLVDDWGNEINATDLTQPWTFRGGPTARDVYMRFRTGMDGTPMPSFKSAASDAEMMNLANYVVSMGRKPVWNMTESELMAFYNEKDREARNDPVGHGRYLVRSFGCAFCHSPVREDGSVLEGMLFAGGQRWNLYPFGDFVSYNLTSDKETGLGDWTDDQLKTFLTKGIRRDGSRMLPFPMPWTSYAGLREDDLNAIIAYLRTIPPVHNKIPLPQRAGIFSYLWGKFQILILGKDLPGYIYPGNAGMTKDETGTNDGSLAETGKEARP